MKKLQQGRNGNENRFTRCKRRCCAFFFRVLYPVRETLTKIVSSFAHCGLTTNEKEALKEEALEALHIGKEIIKNRETIIETVTDAVEEKVESAVEDAVKTETIFYKSEIEERDETLERYESGMTELYLLHLQKKYSEMDDVFGRFGFPTGSLEHRKAE